MDKFELISHIREMLNDRIPVAYIKYRTNPPSMQRYFPDKWSIGITNNDSPKDRNKFFEVKNLEEASYIIKELTGTNPSKEDYNFELDDKLYISIEHN